jgi:hypothetical protein
MRLTPDDLRAYASGAARRSDVNEKRMARTPRRLVLVIPVLALFAVPAPAVAGTVLAPAVSVPSVTVPAAPTPAVAAAVPTPSSPSAPAAPSTPAQAASAVAAPAQTAKSVVKKASARAAAAAPARPARPAAPATPKPDVRQPARKARPAAGCSAKSGRGRKAACGRTAPLKQLTAENAQLPIAELVPDPCTLQPVFVSGQEKLLIDASSSLTTDKVYVETNYQNVSGFGVDPLFTPTEANPTPSASDVTDQRYQANATTHSMTQEKPSGSDMFFEDSYELIALNANDFALGHNLLVHLTMKYSRGVMSVYNFRIECTAPGPPAPLL